MKSVTKRSVNFGGWGGAGLAPYATERYEIFTIMCQKFQYMFYLFLQNSVQATNCNRS